MDHKLNAHLQFMLFQRNRVTHRFTCMCMYICILPAPWRVASLHCMYSSLNSSN